MVNNVHERLFNTHLTIAMAGELIDRLGEGRNDALWPAGYWPPIRFDRPLGVGAVGGHGPIRYFVEAYEPGRSIRFRFTAPRGFVGTHVFDVRSVAPETVQFRHALTMRLEGMARLSWPLIYRWLHDALIEDALDCAEANCTSQPVKKRHWSLWVRLLRHLTSYAMHLKQAARRGRRVSRSRKET